MYEMYERATSDNVWMPHVTTTLTAATFSGGPAGREEGYIRHGAAFMIKMKSFVEVSPDSHFSIQNLPYGVFSTTDNVSIQL